MSEPSKKQRLEWILPYWIRAGGPARGRLSQYYYPYHIHPFNFKSNPSLLKKHMATGPLPPPITSSLISSSSNSHSTSTSSSGSKLPPLLSPSPLPPRHVYQQQQQQQQAHSKRRRELLLKGGLGLLPLALVESILKEPLTVPSAEAKEAVVGSYLPPSPSDPSFVLFKASAKDTPALRAGTYFTSFLFISFFNHSLMSSLILLHWTYILIAA